MEDRTIDPGEDISGHWIVCGAGRFGLCAACVLAVDHELVVVLERDPDRAGMVRLDGALVVCDDAAHDDVLTRAGIERARGLVCALPAPADNIAIAGAARRRNPSCRVIARADDVVQALSLHQAGAHATVPIRDARLSEVVRRLVRSRRPDPNPR